MTPVLEIRDLWVHREGNPILHGISLTVERGEIVALIGPNGAGKSTLLEAVAGLIAPTSGEILFLGTSLLPLPPHERATRGLLLVPEGRRVFPLMSVEENLKMGTLLQKTRRESPSGLEEVFSLFPFLRERRRQKAGSLSGGEQQMLAIARSLLASPTLLLLDEPCLGLAPKTARATLEKVKETKEKGIAVLVADQNIHLTLQAADRAYLMEKGRITLEGAASELLKSPYVKKAYLGLQE